MQCVISSRAGQTIAKGRLIIQKDESGELRLSFLSNAGSLIPGGVVDAEGDLTLASQVLFRQFFETWGLSDLTLTATSRNNSSSSTEPSST